MNLQGQLPFGQVPADRLQQCRLQVSERCCCFPGFRLPLRCSRWMGRPATKLGHGSAACHFHCSCCQSMEPLRCIRCLLRQKPCSAGQGGRRGRFQGLDCLGTAFACKAGLYPEEPKLQLRCDAVEALVHVPCHLATKSRKSSCCQGNVVCCCRSHLELKV